MYALIFNPQKVLLNKPKDLLILQMFCQLPNLVSQNHLEIDRTFVTPTNLLVYLTNFLWVENQCIHLLNQQMFILSVRSSLIKFQMFCEPWQYLTLCSVLTSKPHAPHKGGSKEILCLKSFCPLGMTSFIGIAAGAPGPPEERRKI
jgi:hypothetical protein